MKLFCFPRFLHSHLLRGIFALTVGASFSQAATVSLADILDSYAWGSTGSVPSGTYSFNIWDDATGLPLASNNGDSNDVTVTLSTTIGPLGAGAFDYNATSDNLRMSHSFTGAVASNNPGNRLVNTVRITFANHVTITNLNTDFTSLNTAGIAWETSRLAALKPDGSYFSAVPTLDPYLSYAQVNGSPSQGFFLLDTTTTVNNVGTAIVTAGASGNLENLTGTNGNSYLDYTDLGLPANTQIGGFEWVTVLEDVRGTSNANTSFTSTMESFSVAGSIVPEPSVAGLVAAAAGGFIRRRRR